MAYPFVSVTRQKNALYDGTRMHVFVSDPTHESLPTIIQRVHKDLVFVVVRHQCREIEHEWSYRFVCMQFLCLRIAA